MMYYLLWSNKNGNYWYSTDDVKKLQNPLIQVINLHNKKVDKTSKPTVIHGKEQKITSITQMVDGKEQITKCQIEDK